MEAIINKLLKHPCSYTQTSIKQFIKFLTYVQVYTCEDCLLPLEIFFNINNIFIKIIYIYM